MRAHARGLSMIALATIVGVVATFLAQILSARYLAPAEFGLFAAFLVIVNVAAVGSSSLQNLVTVQTAAALARNDTHARTRTRWPRDAIAIGLGGGAVVAALSPLIAGALDTTVAVVIAAGLSIPLTFVFADALGLLQGAGNVARAVWWTTASQVARVALILVAMILALGVGGIIAATLVAIAACLVGAAWAARRIPRPATGVFSADGLTIVVLTVSFAWLTTSDVFYLRAGAEASVAGTYAAVTVLVRAGFIIPATLSLYLLPRFVRNRDNAALSRLGVLLTLGLSLATGLALTAVLALWGPLIISLLYGNAYSGAVEMLVPVSLAYLPWIAAQGMLIKMTSSASRAGAIALVIAVVAQFALFTWAIPDVPAMLVALGAIGAAVLAVFLLVDRRASRRAGDATRPVG
ncbi:oligosaccharide flippase family protein [Microbacterium atlanticum]|uniref:oligosaccharide flippase family protein n=1 Tax=Microbacterium atlanticum TaxID=2782168 RepID=UPI0018881A37|nr:oligosaccharide flippase family protein [Microbacterium atlanticum]